MSQPTNDRSWFLNTPDGSQGPYTLDELRAWRREGTLTDDHYLWREGYAEWRRCAEIAELTDTPVSTSPPAPSPSPAPAPAPIAASASTASTIRVPVKRPLAATPPPGRKRLVALLLVLVLAGGAYYLFGVRGADGEHGLERRELDRAAVETAPPPPVAVGRITFLGGASQVSGSCHLVEFENTRLLIDAGAFYEDPEGGRGLDAAREAKLYANLPVPPTSLDFVVVTHAHVDHIGRLPHLFALGARPRIILTPPTRDIMLLTLKETLRSSDMPGDRLVREKGARVYHSFPDDCPLAKAIPEAKRETFAMGRSRARDERVDLCEWCLNAELGEIASRCEPVEFGRATALTDSLSVELHPAGHMLGAAWARITYRVTPETSFVLSASGDLGEESHAFFPRTAVSGRCDYALVESTYGGKDDGAGAGDPWEEFRPFLENVRKAVSAGQLVLIPSFVTDRAHKVLSVLAWGRKQGLIPPRTPLYLTSPTAEALLEVYGRHVYDTSPYYSSSFLATAAQLENGRPFEPAGLIRKTERQYPFPSIVVAHSAMMEYGESFRLADLLIEDPRLHVVFVGYQAPYTPGGRIKDETAQTVTIAGRERRIAATRADFPVFSGHAARPALIGWLRDAGPTEGVFVTHGDPRNSERVARAAMDELRLPREIVIPRYGQSFPLLTRSLSETRVIAVPEERPSPPRLSSATTAAGIAIEVSRIENGDVTIGDGLTVVGLASPGGTWPAEVSFPSAAVGNRLRQAAKDRRTAPSKPLEITAVELSPEAPGGSVLAEATVVFDGAIRVAGVKLLKRQDGTTSAVGPSVREGTEWKGRVTFSRQLAERIAAKIREAMERRPAAPAAPPPGAPAATTAPAAAAAPAVTALQNGTVTLGGVLTVRGVKEEAGRVTWPAFLQIRNESWRAKIEEDVRARRSASAAKPLEITRVWSRPAPQGNLLGFADVEFGGGIVVRNFRVMKNASGEEWLAVPSEKRGAEWVDLVELPNAMKAEILRRAKATR